MYKSIILLAVCGGLLLNSCEKTEEKTPEKKEEVVQNLEKGILKGNLKKSIALTKEKYKLEGSFIVEAGATLTIPAGTKIEAKAGGTAVYIAVMMGGKITIAGTAAKPVVMSSKDGKAGDWGGLVICGKAKTTAGENSTAEIGSFKYGGNNAMDSSGAIAYLVIKGTGAAINSESEYNGISFYAVGSGTVVQNIAVIDGKDDGVEFFGGSVSASNLYLKDNQDDSVDWTEGWNGTLTKTYITHTKDGFSTALEGDKANEDPKFIGLTCISTVGNAASSQTALQFKKLSGATITNLWIEGYAKTIEFKDLGKSGGPADWNAAKENVNIEEAKPMYEGSTAKSTTKTYQKAGAKIDTSGWAWKNASL